MQETIPDETEVESDGNTLGLHNARVVPGPVIQNPRKFIGIKLESLE